MSIALTDYYIYETTTRPAGIAFRTPELLKPRSDGDTDAVIIEGTSTDRRASEAIDSQYIVNGATAYIGRMELDGPNNLSRPRFLNITLSSSADTNTADSSLNFTAEALQNLGLVIYNYEDGHIIKIRLSDLTGDTTNPYDWRNSYTESQSIINSLRTSNYVKVLLVDTTHEDINWERLRYHGDVKFFVKILPILNTIKARHSTTGVVAQVLGGTSPYTFAWTIGENQTLSLAHADRQHVKISSGTNSNRTINLTLTVTDNDNNVLTDTLTFLVRTGFQQGVRVAYPVASTRPIFDAGTVIPIGLGYFSQPFGGISNREFTVSGGTIADAYDDETGFHTLRLWTTPTPNEDTEYTLQITARASPVGGGVIENRSSTARVTVRKWDTVPESTIDEITGTPFEAGSEHTITGTWATGGDDDDLTITGEVNEGTLSDITVNDDGTWSTTYTSPRRDGNTDIELTIRAVDPGGHIGQSTAEFVVLSATEKVKLASPFSHLQVRLRPRIRIPQRISAITPMVVAPARSRVEAGIKAAVVLVNILTPPQRVEGGEEVELTAEITKPDSLTLDHEWFIQSE